MTRVTGPKDGNAIKVKFDGKSKTPIKLQNGSCVVLLSIKNNKYCTQKWLKTIAHDATKEFKQVTFLIVDELQKYNINVEENINDEIQLNKRVQELRETWWCENESSFISLVLSEGSYEVEKFEGTLNGLGIEQRITKLNQLSQEKSLKFDIKLWKDWIMSCPEYTKEQASILEKFRTEPILVKALEESIGDFIKRNDDQNQLNNLKKASEKFLLEESPGLMIVAAKLGYDFIAYPGDQIEAFKSTYEYFLKKEYQNKASWLHINFVRYHKQEKIDSKVTTNPNQKYDDTQIDSKNVPSNLINIKTLPISNNMNIFYKNDNYGTNTIFEKNNHNGDKKGNDNLSTNIDANTCSTNLTVVKDVTKVVIEKITNDNLNQKQIEDLGSFMAAFIKNLTFTEPNKQEIVITSINTENDKSSANNTNSIARVTKLSL